MIDLQAKDVVQEHESNLLQILQFGFDDLLKHYVHFLIYFSFKNQHSFN
jgi:hypothetical protein